MALLPLILAAALASGAPPLYLGADLSFTNEMEDCGAVFRKDGRPADPFRLLRRAGGNIVRVRLWNHPTWTNYSTLADVEKTIRRARQAKLKVLLDFHYSDDWADGDKQMPPVAWAGLPAERQAVALHDYTLATLETLNAAGLLPDMVQVGNETNGQLLAGPSRGPIDWQVNALLLNAGLRAVREASARAGRPIVSILHIAQPEHAEPWFAAATRAGVTDFDTIGLSYYRKWSNESMPELAAAIGRMRAAYAKPVMVVETAYPYTVTGGADTSGNVLGADGLDPGYPASPEGQRDYMIALTRAVVGAGGSGVIYWAPDWISTRCRTRWGQGSTWENATWFDLGHRWNALPVFDWLSQSYGKAAPAAR